MTAPDTPRLLVVEDDPINQEVICAHLELLGLQFDVADDGLQALQAWRASDPALILTDLVMPRLDGHGLVRELGREAAASGRVLPPVIVLTARSAPENRAALLASGASEVLLKPVALGQLRQALQRWLPAAALAAPAGAATEERLLDVGVLEELLGHDAAAVAEVLSDFAGSAQALGAELQAALATGDFAHTRALAHKLTSAASSVGALALAAACRQLERLHGQGDADEGAARARGLGQLVRQTLAATAAARAQALARLQVAR